MVAILRPGSRSCLCRACGAAFQSVRAFEAHRVGPWDERRCLTTPRMAERGLQLDPRGFWRWPQRAYARAGGTTRRAAAVSMECAA